MSKEFDCGNLKEYGKRGPGCFHFSYDDRRRKPNELNPGSEGLSGTMKRFPGAAVILAGLCSLAMAEDPARPLPETLYALCPGMANTDGSSSPTAKIRYGRLYFRKA